jgi:arylsulfatase
MPLLTGKGPSARQEVFYFAETTLGAVRVGDYKYRFIDQPTGWLGGTLKVDMPILVNLRLDPFERTGLPTASGGSLAFYNWFLYEFWRFVLVQQEVAEYAKTLVDFPPMQKGGSFNLEAIKAQLQQSMAGKHGE